MVNGFCLLSQIKDSNDTQDKAYQKVAVFLLIGLVYVVAPEWINQVLIHHSLQSYATTLVIDAALILLSYVLWLAFGKRIVQYFFTVGFLGLLFEWFAVGNNPFSSALQVAMFAYWSSFLVFPVLLLDPEYKSRRSAAIIIICVAILQFIIATLLITSSEPAATAGFVAVVIVTFVVFFLWWWPINYVFRLPKLTRKHGKLRYISVVLFDVILELSLPKPIGAIIGFAVFGIFFWWIMHK